MNAYDASCLNVGISPCRLVGLMSNIVRTKMDTFNVFKFSVVDGCLHIEHVNEF